MQFIIPTLNNYIELSVQWALLGGCFSVGVILEYIKYKLTGKE